MPEEREYPINFRRMYFQLNTGDLERAKKFYEDIFNLEVTWYETPEAGWCEFHLPGGSPRLGLNATEEEFYQDSGVLTMDVEDLEATKVYLESKGVETTEIVDIPGMVSYFNMKDSEGNRLQIVSEPRVSG
ncbi:MAG: VOC family protein [Candidatus Bathyarchaeota archaeon]|nr:MAG: VOC family protein [Candidatus Bathyarchaeota archaeon]